MCPFVLPDGIPVWEHQPSFQCVMYRLQKDFTALLKITAFIPNYSCKKKVILQQVSHPVDKNNHVNM